MKIKPCPFCGSKAILKSDFGKIRGCMTALVVCLNNKCRSSGYLADSCVGETEETAINAWNKRAI